MSRNSTILQREDLLKTILSQPSAPFREAHVIQAVTQELGNHSVPYFLDPVGNIVVGASSAKDYQALLREKTVEPVRVFIAHMDHPGFHGTRWRTPQQLEVKWHGGSPTDHCEGAPVWIADRAGWFAEGRLTQVKMKEPPVGRVLPPGYRMPIDTAVVEIERNAAREGAPATTKAEALYGGLRFRATHWQEGDLIYTKAADDLVGTFAVTSLAIELFAGARKKKNRVPFIGLLTRAEEVGFIGAIGHFERGWLTKAKRPVLCVSLETSRALPGAVIGQGPVLRLGDKFTVFNAGALRVFTELAAKTLPGRHQKRVMDGGTCEGTTAMAYGLPTVGISVPLGNYHNQCFEGGPDSAGPNGPAPEFVHLHDVAGLVELCRALMQPKLSWANPWKAKIAEFKKDLKGYRALLRSGP